MAPRGFTNPAPKTDSARSALSSFTCTLCNKSYSRHPEYEAHIGSYDHQHRKRLQDLKQLSRDPNAAERARKAERKADAEAGLIRVGDNVASSSSSTSLASKSAAGASAAGTAGGGKGGGGGGFKKGGFKSSFTTVKGPGTSTTSTAAPVRKNVLGDDDDDDDDDDNNNQNGRGGNNGRDENVDIHSDNKSANRVNTPSASKTNRPDSNKHVVVDGGESDTDDEYSKNDPDQAYYDPSRPTGCFEECAGRKIVSAV